MLGWQQFFSRTTNANTNSFPFIVGLFYELLSWFVLYVLKGESSEFCGLGCLLHAMITLIWVFLEALVLLGMFVVLESSLNNHLSSIRTATARMVGIIRIIFLLNPVIMSW